MSFKTLTPLELINSSIKNVQNEMSRLEEEKGRSTDPESITVLDTLLKLNSGHLLKLTDIHCDYSTFGGVRKRGVNGGYVTKMLDLPVGTNFYVHNGRWRGKIVLDQAGNKCIAVSSNSTLKLLTEEHELEITITEENKEAL